MANPGHMEILLAGVDQWNAWREENPETTPDLREGELDGLDLSRIDFKGTELWRCSLVGTNLSRANLSGADLRLANLREACLSHANLRTTAFIGTDLTGADFSHAAVWRTLFCNVDLSTAKGLETVKHHGASTLGMDTLLISGTTLPLGFLRGVGLPDEFATSLLELIKSASSGDTETS